MKFPFTEFLKYIYLCSIYVWYCKLHARISDTLRFPAASTRQNCGNANEDVDGIQVHRD